MGVPGEQVAQLVLVDLHDIGQMQRLVFGELSDTRSQRVTTLLELLAGTKVEAVLSDDILQVMWEKLVMLAALAATTTLTRATVGEIVATRSGAAMRM